MCGIAVYELEALAEKRPLSKPTILKGIFKFEEKRAENIYQDPP